MHLIDKKSSSLSGQRGVTMVSVMLLVVSLLTLGLLVVRSSVREVTQAGQLVARERALMVAQAAIDLAAAQYRTMNGETLSGHLTGYNPQGAACASAHLDCIPDADSVAPTGQRNELLAGAPVDCGGRPCMRQGAVVRLPAAGTTNALDWCGQSGGGVPFNDIVANGDAEARVCVWVRNNAADALGPSGSGSWTVESDGRIVLTAMATVRNTTVAIEQEVLLAGSIGPQVYKPQSADEGYGGGHNNDNSSVSVCTDDYAAASKLPAP